ncbi:sensor kinase/response regulator fusion protein [Caballeronia terrestris]|uniref:histidine kinase n=1 Tax=Caballeronia terrestris TaxID=1226301 RepID=A0A158F7G9_9BURK|nr:response regulator [Caballeronia terrestris]SAL14980.1 sensor kinase/response regulator fusion protein [Caballeronia terrestris]
MTDSSTPEPAMARLDDADSLDFPLPALPLDEGVVTRLSPADARLPAPHPAFDAFFRSLLDGSTDCIEVLRHDGTVDFINAHGVELREIDDFTPMRGKSWISLWPEEARERATHAVDAALAGQHAHFEAACPTARGTVRHWEVTVSPVQDAADGVEWMVSVSRDITPRVLAERSLDAARQERATHGGAQAALAQSEKMEAIGKLTGGVAHDFNNVLQVIGGNLQLASQHAHDDETLLRRLESAHEAVERGAMLSSQLLAFARRQPLEPVAIDVGKLLNASADALKRTLGGTIELDLVIAEGLWNTLVDRHHLQSVLVNLVVNAREAMDSAGRLTIEAANTLLTTDYSRDDELVAGGEYVRITVSDTGYGMTPAVLDRAFEPFFTTKSDGRGTGLGLSMAYGFLRQTGGAISLQSEIERGTTVTLHLPRTLDEEAPCIDTASEPVTGGDETILVVEDDPDVRATVVEMLAQLGYRVLQTSDAQSALIVLDSGAHIDMLFTDVVMPGPVRSVELARRAKEMIPSIEVLFTSGYTEDVIVHKGRLDPGLVLISKPYRRDALARKIRAMFRDKKAPRAEMQEAKALRVLIVEDDVNTRDATRELLQLLGAEVSAADHGKAALALFDTHAFDVLLTDVRMPGMSGIELAREAKRLRPELRVVFASGYGLNIASEIDADMANVALLPKPFDLDSLEKAVFAKD